MTQLRDDVRSDPEDSLRQARDPAVLPGKDGKNLQGRLQGGLYRHVAGGTVGAVVAGQVQGAGSHCTTLIP